MYPLPHIGNLHNIPGRDSLYSVGNEFSIYSVWKSVISSTLYTTYSLQPCALVVLDSRGFIRLNNLWHR